MSSVWPISLPQKPLFNDYRERDPDNTIVQTMEVGPPKLRPRSTSKGETIDVAFVFTSDQKATFKTFTNSTLAYRSLPFEWPHPETGISYDWIFTSIPEYIPLGSFYVDGVGYTTLWKCRFSLLRKV